MHKGFARRTAAHSPFALAVCASAASPALCLIMKGCVRRLQVLAEQPDSKLAEAVAVVNSSYPEEIVRYYSPTYSTQLLQKLDAMAAQATVGA